MPNRVVHFEIEAEDPEKLKQFYSAAFGWDMQQMGAEYGDYVVINTGKFNDPADPGINGGLYKKQGDKKEYSAYVCVVGVEDINKAMEAVKAAGGEIIGEVVDIPKVGLNVRVKDPDGNNFSLLQPSQEMMDEK